MMKYFPIHTLLRFFYAGCLLALVMTQAIAAEVAGTVELVDGTVWVQGADNKMRSVSPQQSLYEGDIIITGKDGELQARMQDEALIAVRSNSKLKIESYRAKGDEEDNAVFSLIIGTFRSVTGWIGKYNRKNYAIKTTAATIGVRGTDHEPMYIPPPVPGMKPLAEPGVYDKVNSGRIVIKNAFGESEFGKGQAGFVSLDAKRPAIKLKSIPKIFAESRHEKRIAKVIDGQHKKLDQGLIRKQQLMKKQLRDVPPGKPTPRLLKPLPERGGFVPGQKSSDRKLNKPHFNETTKPATGIAPPAPLKTPEKPQLMRPPVKLEKPVLRPTDSIPENGKTSLPAIQTKQLPVPAPLTKPIRNTLPAGSTSSDKASDKDDSEKTPEPTLQTKPETLINKNTQQPTIVQPPRLLLPTR